MMNQRTSLEADLPEAGAGISRRAMMTAAPTLGLGAAALGLGAAASLAKDQEATEVGRLYAEWKCLYEQPEWRTADEAIVDAMTDRLTDLEQRIAALPSASIMDVYRKLAIADAHEVFVGADFDLAALANEARMVLGDAAPVLQSQRA